jgi:hypothetical protein
MLLVETWCIRLVVVVVVRGEVGGNEKTQPWVGCKNRIQHDKRRMMVQLERLDDDDDDDDDDDEATIFLFLFFFPLMFD